MLNRNIVGIETEYGLTIEGRGASTQVEDAQAVVRTYPGDLFVGWDYRNESPRADLRGFKLQRLTYDPEDMRFDEGKSYGPPDEVRADRILPNGARLYNDHGHPEYSTPECISIAEVALHDRAGEIAVVRAASAYEALTGLRTRVYKNNTDFHGASYGTHENYLAPRSLGFERLYEAIAPMLVARQILCGAGKVGSESGDPVHFQISARADFFSERFNAETLFRRPIFNTRDEPHADPREFIRLHVIASDANRILSSTARKVGLVKLALALAALGEAPLFKLRDPVKAYRDISRDCSREFRIELEDGGYTTAYELIESYLAAAEARLDVSTLLLPISDEPLIPHCRRLLAAVQDRDDEAASKHLDWLAKRRMLEQYIEAEGVSWNDPVLQAFDLEYANAHPEESLFSALELMGAVETPPIESDLLARLERVFEPTRARARGSAVRLFKDDLKTATWATLTFDDGGQSCETYLDPLRFYPETIENADHVGTFISMIGDHE